MFSILKLHDKKIETLLFGDLLEKASIILTKEQELKFLAARAQGEITLKESI